MRLFEWHSSKFEWDNNKADDFITYLAGVWKNRNRYSELDEEPTEEDIEQEKIQKQRFFDFTYDGEISARNYVGVVQFEDIRVEIYPKIFAGDDPDNKKKWQLNLLYWLSYCRKIKFPFSFGDVSKIPFDDYLELLIYVFANYAEEILSQQPFQSYQTVEEETTFLRGRLSFDNYVKHNLITGKWQNFYCSYEPFVYDNLFNRIIKYVTRRLYAISQNYLNKEKLSEIIFLLDEVTDIQCSAIDCEKVRLNPLFEDHKHILGLCKLFLSNQVIDTEHEDSKNFCFLIPMEYIFEDFVFGFISDKWPELGVKSQSETHLAKNKSEKVFKIKNDIYINDKLIIDTKYKVRSTEDGLKAGVSQTDLYQMVSYAIRRNCTNVILLYPMVKGSQNEPAEFTIQSDLMSQELNIHVKNIDITFDDIHEAESKIKRQIEELDPVFILQAYS